MGSRKRITSRNPNVTGGGGGGPTPGGTILWGPDFGEGAGNDDGTFTAGAALTMPEVNLDGGFGVGAALTMPEVNLDGGFGAGCALTGEVLGAPFWQSVETQTATSGTSITVTKPTGTGADELLLAFVGYTPGVASAVETVESSGWTLLHSVGPGTPNTLGLAVLYKITGGSEPSSYQFDFEDGLNNSESIDNATAEVHRIIAVDTTTPIDASDVDDLEASALDTDPDAPSITTTVSNALVFAWIIHDHLALNQTHTPDAGHTEATDFEAGAATFIGSHSQWRVFATAGATGTAEHNCTETVATNARMARVAIAPGALVIA